MSTIPLSARDRDPDGPTPYSAGVEVKPADHGDGIDRAISSAMEKIGYGDDEPEKLVERPPPKSNAEFREQERDRSDRLNEIISGAQDAAEAKERATEDNTKIELVLDFASGVFGPGVDAGELIDLAETVFDKLSNPAAASRDDVIRTIGNIPPATLIAAQRKALATPEDGKPKGLGYWLDRAYDIHEGGKGCARRRALPLSWQSRLLCRRCLAISRRSRRSNNSGFGLSGPPIR